MKLLSKGLFEKKFMDSKVKTKSMTKKELVFGHMIGPLGMVMLINTIGALLELYYTEQVPLDTLYGKGTYITYTTVRSVCGTLFGLLLAWMIQNTKSRQGRFRPWVLIGGIIACFAAPMMFLVPKEASMGYLASVYVSGLLYAVVGVRMYDQSSHFVSVSSRDTKERTDAFFYRKLALTLISGILIGLVLISVIYYRFLLHNVEMWHKLILGVAIFAFVMIFVEYFWIKERVTEDEQEIRNAEHKNSYPLKDQLKALLTDKYYIIMIIATFLIKGLEAVKGGNVSVNYCRWVLGANAENNLQMIYTIASGVPLGIGAMAVHPLVKKFGVRKLSIMGFALEIIACIFGWIFAGNPMLAIAFGFVKNMGLLPYLYVTESIFASALDNVEYRTGMRLDGMLGVSIIGVVTGLLLSPIGGLYETVLLAKGFDASIVTQSAGVNSWISFCFWGIDIIIGVVVIITMILYDIEDKLPEIHRTLLERKKHAAEEKGIEWIDPEEEARIEKENMIKEREENRIADLKAKCDKKGLDFETENRKYLEKQEKKKKRSK